MSSLDSGVVVRVERVVDPKRACDVLVVGKEDLIDLEAEEYRDFPFQGTGAELEEEVRQVQELLMGCQPLAAPSSRRSKQRGSGGRRLPVLGHSGDRANEIDRENGRLVRRLQQVGNALPSGAMSGEEHDRVRGAWGMTFPRQYIDHV